ncbi:MAG: hypothetical protein QOH73_1987 [Gaiellaceae bacterium]|nr:hypothetical protein [Gaiellaceae bacterium]
MSEDSPETAWQPRERPARKPRRSLKPLLGAALLLALAFAVAFGMAIHDNPKPGGTQTIERTITLKVAPLHP